MLEAELGELEIFPGRRQILGAQRNPRLHVAVALGEAVKNPREAEIVAFLLMTAAAERWQLLPCFRREPPIFRQAHFAENVGIEPGRAVEGSVALSGLAFKKVAG